MPDPGLSPMLLSDRCFVGIVLTDVKVMQVIDSLGKASRPGMSLQ